MSRFPREEAIRSKAPRLGKLLSVPGVEGTDPGKTQGTMGGPGRPRHRLILLAAAFDPGVGVGEDAGSAAARARTALGVPSRSDRPHLRASDRAGVPPARRGASCSHDPLPRPQARAPGFQELRASRPPLVRPRAREQSQESAQGRRLEPGTGCGHAAALLTPTPPLPSSRRAEARGGWRGPAPPSPGDPTRAGAHLILDLGREPVGRALVEVGHGDRLREQAALSSGVLPLGFPAPGPEEWPQRQRLGGCSPGRRRGAGGASKARSDWVPQSLGSALESRTHCPLLRPRPLGIGQPA